MRTCILADNQYITSEGLFVALKQAGYEIIIRVSKLTELQEKLRDAPNAVVVIDYTLFDFTSMQQLLNVKQAAPKSSWLLFSNELGDYFLRCVTASDPAISVVMKGDSKDEIKTALEKLYYDIPYICDAVEQMLKSPAGTAGHDEQAKLTAAEKQILHEIAKGKTTKEIAYEKFLSFHTVNSHRKNIFRKLGVNNLHEAIRYAIRAGIFDVAEYYI
jgi:DNA-binding NarL/FixJ family response regulator